MQFCANREEKYLTMETVSAPAIANMPGPSGDSEENSSVIKAMDKTSVHRLCSGQVVLSMSIAVKELVENAIDAGATNIEIRLQDYGAKVIEVIDNGKGVTQENIQALTLKHHTSKISEFEDVSFVSTFGFRGEALSSLCALSKLSITTRDISRETGCKVDYDHNGLIVSKEHCARSIGTTVKLNELFCTMPVRLKEFQRNLKKEFNKMVHNLHAYCLISTGTRITCVNTTEKGKRCTIVNTGGHSPHSQISEIFGASQIASLQEIQWKDREPFQDILADFYLTEKNCSNFFKMYTLTGFISTCEHGKGRSSPDRQFFYINNRPCDMPKVLKLMNEVYHQFNRHQYPFIFLNIKSNNLQNVDINVTPDKRMIFLENEKLLFATIKSCLMELFGNTPSTYKLSTMPLAHQEERSMKEKDSSILSNNDLDGNGEIVSVTASCDKSEMSISKLRSRFGENLAHFSRAKETMPRTKRSKRDSIIPNQGQTSIAELWKATNSSVISTRNISMDSLTDKSSNSQIDNELKSEQKINAIAQNHVITPSKDTDTSLQINSPETTITHFPFDTMGSENKDVKIEVADEENISESSKKYRKEKVVNFSIDAILKRNQSKFNKTLVPKNSTSTRFQAAINPKDNSNAEAELQKEIKKQDFLSMKVFGQFNRGFIIAALDDDLFIVDQHASDEKVCIFLPYNYKSLKYYYPENSLK